MYEETKKSQEYRHYFKLDNKKAAFPSVWDEYFFFLDT